MLGAMDVPAAAAGPWIALGAVLGILLLLAAGAIVRRLRAPSPSDAPAQPADEPRDDLADFLAHPPGTREAPDGPGDGGAVGWPSLASPRPLVERDGPAAPRRGTHPGTVLAGLAVAALLLVGAAAALAAAQRSGQAPPDVPSAAEPSGSATPTGRGRDGVVARMAFEGVVLEEHAVGITAAYPELELTVDAEAGHVARLRLPGVNCLATAVPPEAGDPACRTSRTEYAELAEPDLRVEREGRRLAVSGRFATSWRPPGAPPEPTGRSYQLSVTVEASGDERAGWRTVEGELRWDDQPVPTRADGPASVLRAEG
jgi:hypothetical protein